MEQRRRWYKETGKLSYIKRTENYARLRGERKLKTEEMQRAIQASATEKYFSRMEGIDRSVVIAEARDDSMHSGG